MTHGSIALTSKTPGKLIEKALDVVSTGIGMPQFINADVMLKRALHLWGHNNRVGTRGDFVAAGIVRYLKHTDEHAK